MPVKAVLLAEMCKEVFGKSRAVVVAGADKEGKWFGWHGNGWVGVGRYAAQVYADVEGHDC